MGSGGKGGGQTIEIYDYLSSHDYGICHGPVTLNELWIKDKVVFKCGNYSEREDIGVDLPKLFGGDSAEGGPVGTVEFYPGTDDQLMSTELAGRYALTPETAPGYRGLAHIFLRGEGGKGFKWTTNNPYQPNPRVNVTRPPQTQVDLNPDERLIPASVGIDEAGNLISSAGGDFLLNPDMVGFGGAPVSEDGPGAGDATADVNILTYRDNAKNPEPEDVISSWDNETFYRHNLAEVWGLDSTVLQAAIDENVPFKANVEVNLQQTGTVGSAEARIHFVVVLDNGTRNDNSVPYETATDTLYERETVEVDLPANAVAIEAYFTYTRPSGTFVSVSALLRVGRTLTPDTTSGTTAGTTTLGASGPTFATPSLSTMASLEEAGWSREAIDGGYTFAVSHFQLDAQRTRLGSGPDPYVAQIFHRFWRDATQTEIDAAQDTNGFVEVMPGGDTATSKWTEGGDTLTLVTQAPVASQYFQYSHNAVLVYPIFAAFTRSNSSWFYRGSAFGTGPGNGGTGPGGVIPGPESVCGPYPDANPAHIIFECLRNKDWGLGESASAIDVESFADASTVLFNEKFGLSLGWFGQEQIEKFIQEILDHIKAFLFQSPVTGLWTLKLLRDNYTVDENTPRFDQTNCDAISRKRRGWGETINEILCSYTNPGDEKNATVAAHNLGNMQIQGGIVSETRDYYGIRNPYLAQIVASRDVAEAGYPLFSCQLKVDRSAWTVLPGDVAVFSWPEDGIESMVVRVMSLDYGDPRQKTITVDVIEDIFALDVSFYGPPQDPLDPVIPTPSPLDPPGDPDPDDPTGGTGSSPDPTTQTADQTAFSVPLPVLQKQGFTAAEIDAEVGSAGIMVLAYADDQPVLDIELHTAVTLPNGATEVRSVTTFNPVGSIKIASPLVREHTTTMTKAQVDAIFDNNPRPGDLMFIGRSEAVHELAMLDVYTSGAQTWSVRRGMWDTVPLAWPAGTRIWPQPLGRSKMDPAERLDGESITYRLLPRTSAGRLPYSSASDLVVTATNRAHAPFRPANCQLDGTGFAGVEYLVNDVTYPTEVVATWANRNRTTEDAVYMRWNEGNVTPEAGQTTTLRILNLDGTTSSEITGLTGTSHAIPIATLEAVVSGFVEFVAVHDGEESLYNCRLRFNVLPGSGYGLNYGRDYV